MIAQETLHWPTNNTVIWSLLGYFSMVNEKGQATATVYSKVIELVRERVYKFLTLENMVAYNESFSEGESSRVDDLWSSTGWLISHNNQPHSATPLQIVIPMKSQYVKTTVKAGQTFRILAVFEDDRSRNQKNATTGQTDREKIRGRYVQILSETRQVIKNGHKWKPNQYVTVSWGR